MITYALPAAPEGPVWDLDGSKWEKTTIGTWYTEGDEDLGWSELLNDFGPVTDIPPVYVSRKWFDRWLAAHDAELREQIAREIEVHMRRHDNAQIGFSAVGDAYAHAASIARGKEN